MANIKFFADTAAGTVEFVDGKVWNKNQSSRHNDTWGFHNGEWIKITRAVTYKSSPSRHECDARCMNATGRTMQCECACGGKNHGKGAALICEAA